MLIIIAADAPTGLYITNETLAIVPAPAMVDCLHAVLEQRRAAGRDLP
jgi:hypothetical protein